MRTIAVIAVALALAGTALAGDVGNLPWNQGNIRTLRSLDKAEIFQLITGGHADRAFTEKNIWEFGWYDLADNGEYELLYTGSTGPCCVWLGILSRNATVASGQAFHNVGTLKDTVRDLKGDGRKELIIWKDLAQPGTWVPAAQTPRWPSVYRLNHGKYVESSRDFPNYYDREVLPALNKQITDLGGQTAAYQSAPGLQTRLAIAITEKDKILRALGRDPVAGLNHAYRWMSSRNPQVLQCAIAIFQDIGGHQQEVHELETALPAAFKEADSRKGSASDQASNPPALGSADRGIRRLPSISAAPPSALTPYAIGKMTPTNPR